MPGGLTIGLTLGLAAVGIFGVVYMVRVIRQGGKDDQRADAAEQAAEILEEQRDVAANAPDADKPDDIFDRL